MFQTMTRAILVAGLIVPLAGQTPPGQNAPASAHVIGVGSIAHIVADADRAVKFYAGAMGLELIRPIPPFAMTDSIRRMGNTPGAQSRPVALRIPGSQLGLELIEYKDIERHPIQPRFEDPGSTVLVITVRSLTRVVPALEKAGGSNQGILCAVRCTARMRDPDGFFLAVVEDPDAPTTAPAASNVIGGNFGMVVEDMNATLKVYRDVLGMKIFTQDGRTSAMIPGTQVRVQWVESKRGTTAHSRVQDPGTPILQIQVRDARVTLRALKAAGLQVISEGGEVVPRENGGAFVILRDANNLFLELFQRGTGN